MFDKLQQGRELLKMRSQAMQIQKDLDAEVLEVEKHGVVVRISLAQKIRSIATNGKDDDDITDAVNEALKKSQQDAAKKMQTMMGGLEGLKGLLGG
jgi:hypothetical protein